MSRMYTPNEIKSRKTVGNIIKCCIILMLAAHLVISYQEKQTLADNGYSRSVDVGDYSLNMTTMGKCEDGYRIVGISGLKHGDFSVGASKLAESLGKKNQLIFIDRAGYGLSEDTWKILTVERAVNDYRRALNETGIGPPYVLLAEHFGGVYATYWEATYPSEIEAVVFIDGTEMHESEEESKKGDSRAYWLDAMLSVASRVGASRILQTNQYPIYPASFSPTEQAMGKGLTTSTLDSLAPVLEMRNQWDNIETTYSAVTRNNIPKLYITTDEKWKSREPVPSERGHDFGDVVRLTVKEPGDTLTPYLDQMGNCRLTYLGGAGHLYEYRPEDCGKIIQSFLNNLEHYKKMAVN